MSKKQGIRGGEMESKTLTGGALASRVAKAKDVVCSWLGDAWEGGEWRRGSKEQDGERGLQKHKECIEKDGEPHHHHPCISVHKDPAQAKAALTGTPLS